MGGALHSDLIAAVASPPGQGGVGIIRLSGPGARQIAIQVCGIEPKPRYAHFARYRDPDTHELIDEGLLLWFEQAASFTGEEVIELQCHGSPVVLQRLLDTLCSLGARLARPGEFSERAFLNGRMDLAQAEAVADLIASTSVAAARAAVRSLRGEFSRRVHDIAEGLSKLRVFVEACIDFPDEDVEFLHNAQIAEQLKAIEQALHALRASSDQGRLLRDGISIALVGAPNAGKSSLLNTLSGEDAAIVTDIPGTTRDLLKVDLVIGGLPVRLVDTAGLRDSADAVEQIGVARARQQAREADLVLVVVDVTELAEGAGRADSASGLLRELLDSEAPDDQRSILVLNKTDLMSSGARRRPATCRPGARVPGIGHDRHRHGRVARTDSQHHWCCAGGGAFYCQSPAYRRHRPGPVRFEKRRSSTP